MSNQMGKKCLKFQSNGTFASYLTYPGYLVMILNFFAIKVVSLLLTLFFLVLFILIVSLFIKREKDKYK